jgi:hypothetical protein
MTNLDRTGDHDEAAAHPKALTHDQTPSAAHFDLIEPLDSSIHCLLGAERHPS